MASVVSQLSLPFSTRIPIKVAVMALVQEPRCQRSFVVTLGLAPRLRTPFAPIATILPW